MEGLKFVAIVASVREGRQGERMMKLTEAEFNRVLKPKGHSIEFIGKFDIYIDIDIFIFISIES